MRQPGREVGVLAEVACRRAGNLDPLSNVSVATLDLSATTHTKMLLPVRLERSVDISLLKGHEETIPDYLRELSVEIRMDGFLRRPILADVRTKVILDGHHRVKALSSLGCSNVPVYFVDYMSPLIQVLPWRKGEKVTKEMVLRAGLEGPKLPPKTTRHLVRTGSSFTHVTAIETELNVPLEDLRPAGRRERL